MQGVDAKREAERAKRLGAYYTPPMLAEAIVEALWGYWRAGEDGGGRPPRFLDPAAGEGAFLLAAREVFARRLEIHPGELGAECLHGVDCDPMAAKALCAKLTADGGSGAAIVTGNALLPGADGGLASDPAAGWRRWFPRIFAPGDGEAGFDIIAGNPPYLSVKLLVDPAERRAYKALYRSAAGQYDIYGLFLELGLSLLKPGGVLGFLLPKPFLVNRDQRPIREILADWTLLEIWDLGKVAFSRQAAVESCVVMIRKTGWREGQRFLARTGAIGSGGGVSECVEAIEQRTVRAYPERAFNLSLTPETVRFLSRMEAGTVPLGEWLAEPFGRGIEMGKRGGLPEEAPGHRPVLRGEDVEPFRVRAPGLYLPWDPGDPKRYKPAALYQGPRLLVRRVAHELIAAVDPAPGRLTLNTLYNFPVKEEAFLYALCALLNSAALRAWFRRRYYFTEVLFPYLRQEQILALPIPARARWEAPSPALPGGRAGESSLECLTRLSMALHAEVPGSEGFRRRMAAADRVAASLYGVSDTVGAHCLPGLSGTEWEGIGKSVTGAG